MAWEPPNETGRYDKARVAQLRPIEMAIERLRLPLDRERQLASILNALEVQIEVGGDHPEVNRHLVEALRVAAVHQAGEQQARGVSEALNTFLQTEAERWEQLRAGVLPPVEWMPEEELYSLVQDGYDLLTDAGPVEAVEKWLEAWEKLKTMVTPEIRSTDAFDQTYPDVGFYIFNWLLDLEMELGNAGIDDPVYHEHRVRYVDEFLAQFPDEPDSTYMQMLRAKAKALFELGRSDEGEAVYRDLVTRQPDNAWGYIGWSDQYHRGWGVPVDYERAEELLQQALARPNLKDRWDVMERLADLYYVWGRLEDCEHMVKELPPLRRPYRPPRPPQAERLGRNDPCWCGSGKKYKQCHWRFDRGM